MITKVLFHKISKNIQRYPQSFKHSTDYLVFARETGSDSVAQAGLGLTGSFLPQHPIPYPSYPCVGLHSFERPANQNPC